VDLTGLFESEAALEIFRAVWAELVVTRWLLNTVLIAIALRVLGFRAEGIASIVRAFRGRANGGAG
jgi:hypothetical protein